MLQCTEFELSLGFLKDLIALETVNPPGGEQIAAEYISRQLGSHGIECRVLPIADGRANVLSGTYGGTGPAVLLTGHLDVVPAGEGWNTSPFEAVEQDGKMYGRGACDMKGGIAAMMATAIWARERGECIRPYRLAFTADEEVYGLGTKALLSELSSGDVSYTIIGEPTENQIHIAHRGAIRFRIRLQGLSCHAGNPAKGINAIENMSRVIEAVRLVNKDLQSVRHAVLPPPTMCCTMLSAGTKDNVVPDNCELVVDCRPGVGDTAEGFQQAIEAKIKALGDLETGARLEMETYIHMPAGSVERDSDIVQWARGRYLECFDNEPVIQSFPACCDLSQFTEGGFPAILYGPGSITQAHTANEFVALSQLEQAFAFYCKCLTEA